jgi:hypothetical protein
MKTTPFRLWLQNIWFDNKQERNEVGELPYSQEEYFQKYKYWLKREYRHQQSKDNNEA